MINAKLPSVGLCRRSKNWHNSGKYVHCLLSIRMLILPQNILNKSKYYSAIGILTDVALSRMLEDVLALPDIPADESHRLRELSRMLSALEALFIEETNQASFNMAE